MFDAEDRERSSRRVRAPRRELRRRARAEDGGVASRRSIASAIATGAARLARDCASRHSRNASAWWLDDYALFRALHDEQRRTLLARVGRTASAIARAAALRAARAVLSDAIRYYQLPAVDRRRAMAAARA